jgi:hypothetical protein
MHSFFFPNVHTKRTNKTYELKTDNIVEETNRNWNRQLKPCGQNEL